MGLFILSKRETGYNGWSLQSEGSNILKGFQFTDSYLSTRYCGGLLVSEDHLRAQSCGLGCDELGTLMSDRMAGRP